MPGRERSVKVSDICVGEQCSHAAIFLSFMTETAFSICLGTGVSRLRSPKALVLGSACYGRSLTEFERLLSDFEESLWIPKDVRTSKFGLVCMVRSLQFIFERKNSREPSS